MADLFELTQRHLQNSAHQVLAQIRNCRLGKTGQHQLGKKAGRDFAETQAGKGHDQQDR
jgi:hypothetical protein